MGGKRRVVTGKLTGRRADMLTSYSSASRNETKKPAAVAKAT